MSLVRADQDRFLSRGTVQNGSKDVIVNGRSAVRVGDNVIGGRKKKGINRIVTGNDSIIINGQSAAVVGSRTSLGDRATNGSQDTLVK